MLTTNVATFCHHTMLLQCHWLYSLCCTLIPVTYSFWNCISHSPFPILSISSSNHQFLLCIYRSGSAICFFYSFVLSASSSALADPFLPIYFPPLASSTPPVPTLPPTSLAAPSQPPLLISPHPLNSPGWHSQARSLISLQLTPQGAREVGSSPVSCSELPSIS